MNFRLFIKSLWKNNIFGPTDKYVLTQIINVYINMTFKLRKLKNLIDIKRKALNFQFDFIWEISKDNIIILSFN